MNRALSIVLTAAVLLPASAHAQNYDSSFFAGLEWRNIGPNRGGRSIASAGSPSRPQEYYFGAVGGGLWKTTDGGLNCYQVRNRAGQDPLNFPIKINDRLSALESSIETGSAKPTDAAYRVFAELSGDLDRMLTTLKTIEGTDLKRINGILRASGAAPVT